MVVGRRRVSLGIIERRGRYLICQRPRGTFLGGYWEFPGGKRERGESPQACLRRELLEELGLTVRVLQQVCTMRHRYPSGTILFSVFRCVIARGRPHPIEVAALRWVKPAQFHRYRFPPANRSLLRALSRRARRGIIDFSEGGNPHD